MKPNVIYCDPMACNNNLQVYDDNLLSKVQCEDITYFLNKKYTGVFTGNENLILKYNYTYKKGVFKLLSYLSTMIYLFFFVLINKKSNILHFQWLRLPTFDYYLISLLKKIKKIKFIFTAHDYLPHDTGNKHKKIYEKIYKKADAVIVHTEITKEQIKNEMNIGRDNIHIIPFSSMELPCDDIETDKQTKKLAELYPDDAINFVFPGAIRRNKGIDDLLEAWIKSDILKDGEKCRLIVAGRDPDGFLKNYDIKGLNIYFDLKMLSNEEYVAYMNIADIVLMPYRDISQSGVLFACMEHHKPMMVTNVGGLTEPFKYGNLGWIVNPNAPNEIKETLEHIVQNKSEIESIKNDNELWELLNGEIYSWDKAGRTTTELYEKIANS